VSVYNSNNSYIFLPAPLDLVTLDKRKAVRIPLKESLPFPTDLHCNQYLFFVGKQKVESMNKFYLLHTAFERYLEGSQEEFPIYHEAKFLHIEYKIGIKRNRYTKTSEAGNLYRLGMRRFKDGWLWACDLIGAPSLREKGTLKLGGE